MSEYKLSEEDKTILEGIINTNDYSALLKLVESPLDDIKAAYMQYVAQYSVSEGLEFIDIFLKDNRLIANELVNSNRYDLT